MIEYINHYGYGVSNILEKTLGWLISRINREIDIRFQKLGQVKVGAVKSGEPRIMWMKLCDRPVSDKALSVQNKFNAVLERKIVCNPWQLHFGHSV